MIYLDANASVPPLAAAHDALKQSLEVIGNPSSPHGIGYKARRLVDESRAQIAHAFGEDDKSVIFTSGASEGNRWLVDSIAAWGRIQNKVPHVVTSPFEHPSLMKSLLESFACGNISLHVLQLNELGFLIIDPQILHAADFVCVTAAHNETGIMPNWLAIAAQLAPHTVAIADAAQVMGRVDWRVDRVDAMVVSAHKMGGFPGVGALLLRERAKELPAPWRGGGQEGDRRPGTEPLQLIAAFGAAAAQKQICQQRYAATAQLRNDMEHALMTAWPFAQVIGRDQPRLPNTTAITLNHVDPEALRILLDQAGVAVGFGSACSAMAPEPSAALMAMGLSAIQARSTVRLSFHTETTAEEIQEAIRRIVPVGLKLHGN